MRTQAPLKEGELGVKTDCSFSPGLLLLTGSGTSVANGLCSHVGQSWAPPQADPHLELEAPGSESRTPVVPSCNSRSGHPFCPSAHPLPCQLGTLQQKRSLSVGLTRVINTHLLFLGWAVPVQKIKSWQSWHPRRHVNSDMPPSPNTAAAPLWVWQEVNELFGSRGSLKLPKRRWGAGRDRPL